MSRLARAMGVSAGGRPHLSRGRRGGAIIDIVAAVIFFGLLAAGVLWIIKTTGEAGKQYSTAMINTQNKATTLACQMNLRSIAQSLHVYAIGNDGFPDSRQELVDYCGGSKLLRCPDPCGVDYVYIPGLRGDMPPMTVLVYEPKPVHDGRCNVLFLDGQIASLAPEELKAVVEATLARRRN